MYICIFKASCHLKRAEVGRRDDPSLSFWGPPFRKAKSSAKAAAKAGSKRRCCFSRWKAWPPKKHVFKWRMVLRPKWLHACNCFGFDVFPWSCLLVNQLMSVSVDPEWLQFLSAYIFLSNRDSNWRKLFKIHSTKEFSASPKLIARFRG